MLNDKEAIRRLALSGCARVSGGEILESGDLAGNIALRILVNDGVSTREASVGAIDGGHSKHHISSASNRWGSNRLSHVDDNNKNISDTGDVRGVGVHAGDAEDTSRGCVVDVHGTSFRADKV